jgi:hypothetical protein
VVWCLALVAGVLLATADHRYIANFIRGPYPLARADLDSIRDITATPRYYARVAGDKVLDTGIRQYTVHTQNGVETSRTESGAYHALLLGTRILIVQTASDVSSVAEGRLAPWPSELEGQLFDSKEMRALRANFYPFYVENGSFRSAGYIVIALALAFGLLFAWKALPAWRALRDPSAHPLAARIATWGDPLGVAVETEREFGHPRLTGGNGWRLGDKYLVQSRFFSFDVLRFHDMLWGYKKITKHSVNFIPTGKTYEAIITCYGGAATITGKEKRVDEILAYAQTRAPWAIHGYSAELATAFAKRQQEFVTAVEGRRQDWERQSGKPA